MQTILEFCILLFLTLLVGQVKSCVKVLRDQEPSEVEHLLNALR